MEIMIQNVTGKSKKNNVEIFRLVIINLPEF